MGFLSAWRKTQVAKLDRTELFKLPDWPRDQIMSDLYSFKIGQHVFLILTMLCEDRKRPGLTQIFRMSGNPPFTFDPKPIAVFEFFHPRNIAITPEKDGARWLWVADHGEDFPPFPGGCSPLYRIYEDGRIEVKEDPELSQPEFSFDGCLWADASGRGLFLYQCNIGSSRPRLLYWSSLDEEAENLSHLLPQALVNGKERFLISRLIKQDENGVDLFLGADYSSPYQLTFDRDSLLRIGYDGEIERLEDAVPPRLRDKTWSTVESCLFRKTKDNDPSLLVITHDFGFTEGAVEILDIKSSQLERGDSLPMPSMKGTQSWIARAAIGDVDGDGRNDIVLYLRATQGPYHDPQSNYVLLRQEANGQFAYATCQARGQDTHCVGGFFIGDRLIQLRYSGWFEEVSFSF